MIVRVEPLFNNGSTLPLRGGVVSDPGNSDIFYLLLRSRDFVVIGTVSLTLARGDRELKKVFSYDGWN